MGVRMERLRSVDKLMEVREGLVAQSDPALPTIVISAGTCGQASGANALIRVAKKELLQRKLTKNIALRITGCHGFCAMEPSILVEPGRTFYPRISPDDVATIIDAISNGKIVTDLLFTDPESGMRIERQDDIPFFTKQVSTIMGQNEKIDPIRI